MSGLGEKIILILSLRYVQNFGVSSLRHQLRAKAVFYSRRSLSRTLLSEGYLVSHSPAKAGLQLNKVAIRKLV